MMRVMKLPIDLIGCRVELYLVTLRGLTLGGPVGGPSDDSPC